MGISFFLCAFLIVVHIFVSNADLTLTWNINTHNSNSVVSGTQVTWTTSDGASHTVTFSNNNNGAPEAVNSATFSRSSYSILFNTVGSYSYFCSIHGVTLMSGNLNVTSAGTTTTTTPTTTTTTTPTTSTTTSTTTTSSTTTTTTPTTSTTTTTPTTTTSSTATTTSTPTTSSTSGVATTTTSGSATASTSDSPVNPKLDEHCYNLTISVSKALQSAPQYFTFQDFGCNTTEWNIVSVNTTALFSYQDPNQVKLTIQPNESGVRPVHYQILSSSNQFIHTVETKVDIVNHNPVINSATFEWVYPRTTQTFPSWNLLSDCSDPDGDSLSVVQIEKTKARKAETIVQLNDTVLYFVPERVVVSVLPTGEISLSAPSNSNPVTAGSPLAFTFHKNLSFQFHISDGDVTKQSAWGVADIVFIS